MASNKTKAMVEQLFFKKTKKLVRSILKPFFRKSKIPHDAVEKFLTVLITKKHQCYCF